MVEYVANWRDYFGEEQARGLPLWFGGEGETGYQGRQTAPSKAPHQSEGWANVNITKLATWNQNTTYSNFKVYLDLSFFVWRGERGGKEQDLMTGIHEFPFEFELPENIPSSRSGKYGSIRYIMS